MNKFLREQMLTEAEPFITPSTFQLMKGKKGLYGLGWKDKEKVGSWSIYDRKGIQIRKWEKLNSDTLLRIIHEDTQVRGFLKEGTFSFEDWHFQEKHVLSCWGIGRNGLLFHANWLLTGVCVLEWSAYLPIKVNQEEIENNWSSYRRCKLQNGCW